MSSDLAPEYIHLNNYISLAVVTAVVYDYLLALGREIHFVWSRPWTRVSTIFVLVRYIGLTWAILGSLSTVIVLTKSLAYPIFLAAADLVMILRVYALWGRSKIVFSVLLFLWVSEILVSLVLFGVYSDPSTHLTVTVARTVNFSYCYDVWHGTPSHLIFYVDLPRFTLGAALLMLAIIPSLKRTVRMYKATKQWQPNRYIQQFMKDGLLYFLANELYNVCATVFQSYSLGSGAWMLFLDMFFYVTICPMMPRFILDVRALYDGDLRGVHCSARYSRAAVNGSTRGIDTGFGMSLRPVTTGEDMNLSRMSFADVATTDGSSALDGDSDDNVITDSDIVTEAIPMQRW